MSARCKTGFLTLRKRLFGTAEQAFPQNRKVRSVNRCGCCDDDGGLYFLFRWCDGMARETSACMLYKSIPRYINDSASPVETQNLASPVQQTQQQQAFYSLNQYGILARETQDFASLLLIDRELQNTFTVANFYGTADIHMSVSRLCFSTPSLNKNVFPASGRALPHRHG